MVADLMYSWFPRLRLFDYRVHIVQTRTKKTDARRITGTVLLLNSHRSIYGLIDLG